jgi:hypothetical protein
VIGPKEQELLRLIATAPSKNREFHSAELNRLIGKAAYDARVRDVVDHYGCPKFAAKLAVHGNAVKLGEIAQ